MARKYPGVWHYGSPIVNLVSESITPETPLLELHPDLIINDIEEDAKLVSEALFSSGLIPNEV